MLAVLLMAPALCTAQSQLPPQSIRYDVDYEYLQMIAPDAVGWLYHPNQSINTPVVYSADEKHYLRYRHDGRWDNTGSIYFTGDSAPDFTEPILTLHGGNNMDNSLLGSLSDYRQEGHYENNPTLYLLTPKGDFRLDLFAAIRTTHRDRESWPVEDSPELLTKTLPDILEKSFLTPLPGSLPEEGDQWLLMATEDMNDEGVRYVLYARMRPLAYTDDAKTMIVNQIEMDSRETLNGMYTVENVGSWMLYGQNDPSWNRLYFETESSKRLRPFGDGGCGPTAIAAAIANLVTPEELCRINYFAKTTGGYTICTCSVTEHDCIRRHVPYRINEPEEMLRYFPLVVGNFATGNNTLGVQGRYDRYGTNMSYLEAICGIFGISVERTNDKQEAYDFLAQKKGMAITCTGDYNSPFTNNSHFITLAGVDEEYLYIIDPLRRESYGNLDPRGMLEILTPGLVRITKKNAGGVVMSPIYLLTPRGVKPTAPLPLTSQ